MEGSELAGYVLVVDDEAMFSEMVSLVLESLGWEARTVDTAEAARLAIAEEAPRVALCDLELGSAGGGQELVEWILQTHSDVGIVVVSGHLADHIRSLVGDEVAVLAKPFTIAALSETIESLTG